MSTRHLLKRASIEAMTEQVVVHQFNDNAVRHTRTLSGLTGLQRIGIHLIRIEPGRDSTTHHYHEADEEFIYILSGRGLVSIGDEAYEVSAGDFMGFPTPSPAHSMTNCGEEDLLYLMGGERNLPDVVYYPRIQRSLIKTDSRRRWLDWKDWEDLPPR